LVLGTAFSQGLVVLAAPVLTRLYTPEAFGIATLFTSIVAVIEVIACMRYETAIVLPADDSEGANLLAVSLLFVTVYGLLSVLLVTLGSVLIIRILNAPQLAPFLWMLPIAVFVMGLFKALNYWNTRTRHFSRLSIARIFSSSTSVGGQIGAGAAGFASGGTMIAAHLGGSCIGTVVLGVQILRDRWQFFKMNIRWHKMVSLMKRYKKFPLYGSGSALMNVVSWQLPTFLLSAFFSMDIVGFYMLGHRILRTPMSLIGRALGQVFHQRAAVAYREGRLWTIVEPVFERLVMFSLFPMLLLTIVGKEVFIVFFGSNWSEAGIYSQILSIWTFFWFISSPMSTLIGVLEKQEFGLLLNSLILITRFISLGIGGLLGDARLAVTLFAVSGVLAYGYLNYFIITESGVKWKRVWKILWHYAFLFIPAALILICMKVFQASPFLIVSISMGLSFIYLIYVLNKELGISARLKSLRGSFWLNK